MKAVLDTNVLLSGMFWRGVPYRCLLAAKAGLFELVISDQILEELDRVLITKFHLSMEESEEAVRMIRKMGKQVEISRRIYVVKDDPADDKFLETATAAGAEIIVSGDRHLLELNEYKGIKILKAKDFLKKVLQEETI